MGKVEKKYKYIFISMQKKVIFNYRIILKNDVATIINAFQKKK